MLKPEDVTRYPWGDDDNGSEAHAQWLAKKLIKAINRSLKEGKTKNININCDLNGFGRVGELILEDATESGWYSVITGNGYNQTYPQITLKKKEE